MMRPITRPMRLRIPNYSPVLRPPKNPDSLIQLLRSSFFFTPPLPHSLPSLTTDHRPLTTAVLCGRAYSALPCAGAPPPQRPLSYNMPRRPGVSIATGAQPKEFRQTTSPQSHVFPVGAGLVPALAPSPTDGLHPTARPGACTASRPKTVNTSSHRSHEFPPDYPHPKSGMHPFGCSIPFTQPPRMVESLEVHPFESDSLPGSFRHKGRRPAHSSPFVRVLLAQESPNG